MEHEYFNKNLINARANYFHARNPSKVVINR